VYHTQDPPRKGKDWFLFTQKKKPTLKGKIKIKGKIPLLTIGEVDPSPPADLAKKNQGS
jgi:hypothetical protein